MSPRRSLSDVILKRKPCVRTPPTRSSVACPLSGDQRVFPRDAFSELHHIRYLSTVVSPRLLSSYLSLKKKDITTLQVTKDFIGFDRPPLIGQRHSPFPGVSVEAYVTSQLQKTHTTHSNSVAHVPYLLPLSYSGVHVAFSNLDTWQLILDSPDNKMHHPPDAAKGLMFVFRVLTVAERHSFLGGNTMEATHLPTIYRFQAGAKDKAYAEVTRTTRHTITLTKGLADAFQQHATRGRHMDVEVLTLRVSAIVSTSPAVDACPSMPHSLLRGGIVLPSIPHLLSRFGGGYGPIVNFPRYMVQLVGVHLRYHHKAERGSTPSSLFLTTENDDILSFVNEWGHEMV